MAKQSEITEERKIVKETKYCEVFKVVSIIDDDYYIKGVKFSYRIKSLHLCILKYNKYYPSIELNKCYNDLLEIRIIISDYEEIF